MGRALTDKEKGRLDDQLLQLRQMTVQGELRLGPVRRALQDIIEKKFDEVTASASGGLNDDVRELSVHVMDAELGTKIPNALARYYVATLGDLADSTEEEISRVPNVGKMAQKSLREYLESRGLQFSDPHSPRAKPYWLHVHEWSKRSIEDLRLKPSSVEILRARNIGLVGKFVYQIIGVTLNTLRRRIPRLTDLSEAEIADVINDVRQALEANNLQFYPNNMAY